MILEICPTCGAQDSMILRRAPAVTVDGSLVGGRIAASCNNTQCDQRYWFHPRTGRVTRRNTGGIYQDWKRQDVELRFVNACRSTFSLSELIEVPIPTPTRETLNDRRSAFGLPKLEDGTEQVSVSSKVGRRLYEKWRAVRAFFTAYVPGFRRFGVSENND